jgi:hypothetical protein
MSASRRKPFLPPAMLLEIAESGGSIPADMKAIAARFGLPRRQAAQHIAQLARRELLARNAEQPFYDVAPKGWRWVQFFNPTVARPSPSSPAPPTRPPPTSPAPPRSSSAPPPRPVRDRPHDRMPALTRKEMLLRKQDNQIHILRTIRHFNGIPDNTEHVDRSRLYQDREELGADLGVTVEEYLQVKAETGSFPSSFIPAGLDERQAKAIRDDFNRPGRTKAKSKSRKANHVQMVAYLDCRASATSETLTDQPQTVRQIMAKMAGVNAFLSVGTKRPLTGGSLKKALQRTLDELVRAGRAQRISSRHLKGLPMKLYRRPLR